MYSPLTLFIGLRYVYGKNTDSFSRFISILSMMGLMLGAIALIIVLSVMNGLEREMQKNILNFLPQAQITTPQNQINMQTYPEELFKDLQGTYLISPLITGDVILQGKNGINVSQLMGVNPSSPEPINDYMYAGDISLLQPGQYQVILGQSLAQELQVSIGDKIRLMVPNATQLTPMGRIPSQRLFTVAGLFSVNNDINQSLVYINLDDAAKLMHYPKETITSWRLFLNQPLQVESLVEQPLPTGLMFKDWRDLRGELFAAIKLEKKMMGLLISLIVIVAAFNIITSVGLLVIEKQGEVAILKTQGLTSRRIMQIFVIQGASAGIVGTCIGAIIGITVALNLNTIMALTRMSIAGLYLPVLIEPKQVVIIVSSLIAISVLATIYPAWRAARTQPAEALRYE
ncbi:lipoprotein-releasing ABC transporter permease subunit LolC [Utexia brackfieldae]|uniref:lipoprotein-releasing ABC transporter permease subunit LolC n=1 Tax=Utexia brackfieldae TaxID=3074108 RepID=UPI00370D85D4